MSSPRAINDAPVISAATGIVTILAIPVLIYLMFTVWPESLERQVVGTIAICCVIAFLIMRNKYEALLLALILFSQFPVSLHTFYLNPSLRFPILFSDVIIFFFLLVAIERRQPMHLDKVGRLYLLLISWFMVATLFSADPYRSLVLLILSY